MVKDYDSIYSFLIVRMMHLIFSLSADPDHNFMFYFIAFPHFAAHVLQ